MVKIITGESMGICLQDRQADKEDHPLEYQGISNKLFQNPVFILD